MGLIRMRRAKGCGFEYVRVTRERDNQVRCYFRTAAQVTGFRRVVEAGVGKDLTDDDLRRLFGEELDIATQDHPLVEVKDERERNTCGPLLPGKAG